MKLEIYYFDKNKDLKTKTIKILDLKEKNNKNILYKLKNMLKINVVAYKKLSE